MYDRAAEPFSHSCKKLLLFLVSLTQYSLIFFFGKKNVPVEKSPECLIYFLMNLNLKIHTD